MEVLKLFTQQKNIKYNKELFQHLTIALCYWQKYTIYSLQGVFKNPYIETVLHYNVKKYTIIYLQHAE